MTNIRQALKKVQKYCFCCFYFYTFSILILFTTHYFCAKTTSQITTKGKSTD
nr:MAG TPA: hypothetical protein [Caudoviricetes sp.]